MPKQSTPEDQYKLASDVYETFKTSHPATVRNVISECYYACFHAALELLRRKHNKKFVSDHKQVLTALPLLLVSAGNRLISLHALRINASYHLHTSLFDRDAQKALKYCRAILAEIELTP